MNEKLELCFYFHVITCTQVFALELNKNWNKSYLFFSYIRFGFGPEISVSQLVN